MYSRGNFSPADPDEIETYTFDFRRDVGTDQEISSSEWEIFLVGTDEGYEEDTDLASRLIGPGFTPAGTVKSCQKVSLLQPGNTYILRALATFSDGNIKSLYGYVKCEPLDITLVA